MDALTDRQMEALGILQEEAAEVIQIISKIRRAGPAYRPYDGEKNYLRMLHEELGDFDIVKGLAALPTEGFDAVSHRNAKIEKLRKWSKLLD